MPRWPDKELNAAEMFEGQEKSAVMPTTGSIASTIDEVRLVEPVHTDGVDKVYADALAFMEEKVTVMIHEDADPNAENPVQVACNGTNQFFLRGQAQDVRRKYVEILARAKRTRISTPEITDGSGARTNGLRSASSLRYPFSVLHDSNPKGPAWLKSVLSEA